MEFFSNGHQLLFHFGLTLQRFFFGLQCRLSSLAFHFLVGFRKNCSSLRFRILTTEMVQKLGDYNRYGKSHGKKCDQQPKLDRNRIHRLMLPCFPMSGTQHSESQVAIGSLSFQTDRRWRLHPGREEHKRFVCITHSFMQLTGSPPHAKPCSGIPPRLTYYSGTQAYHP